jgi:curved DNA-binding protein CbpA
MDPSEVLGVPPNAGEEEIRAAYVRKVKEFPPDRSPEEFEKVRDAFETLRDPRKRTRTMLLARDADAPLTSLLEGHAAPRLFAGPQAWRDVLKAK